MADFTYEGITRSGQRKKGRLSAESRDGAIVALRKQGMVPIAVRETRPSQPSYAPGLGGVGVGHLAIFTRKFAQIVKTDIPIIEALGILAEEEESSLVREALDHVRNQLANGVRIEKAMAERPRVFGRLYIRMVQAGLTSGTLDLVADSLARMYETENALRKQIWSKLAYPIILLGFCFLASLVLRAIGFVTPALFALLMTFWLIIVGLGIIGMTKPGYRAYREIGFRLPGIGGMMRNINLARFCRVFGLQYAAGIPVLEGLEVSKEVLQDAALERAIEGMRKRINDGMDLRDAMLAAGVFPRRVVSMVGVGERAGGVDLMLEKLAEYYDLDVQTGSVVLTTLIYFLVYMLVLVTGAIIVISAWGHYFGMIGQLINET